jgi:hypothetical protein
MTTTRPTIDALVKSAIVPQDPAHAFRLFTEDFGRWWPLATHSVGEVDATGVALGKAVGERIVETIRGAGDECWGTITIWEPRAGYDSGRDFVLGRYFSFAEH